MDKKIESINMKNLNRGDKIGKYLVMDKIGEGGGGCVYLVNDICLDIKYALKVSKKEDIVREKEKLGQLSNRRIPYLVDYLENDDMAGIVMEYVEGPTLEAYLKKNAPLSEADAIKLMKELAELLGYLHSMQPAIIFRDLKPANLILDREQNLRLIDFGTALQGYGEINPQQSYGTFGYCAPEQLRQNNLTPACDIYACGMILYYMLTGIDPSKPPFGRGNSKDMPAIVSQEMENLIQKCCELKPENRPSDGNVLLEYLNAYRMDKYIFIRKISYIISNCLYYILFVLTALYAGWSLVQIKIHHANPTETCITVIILLSLTILMKKQLEHKNRRWRFIKKREWNFLYTEKKTIGLWLFFMILFCAFWSKCCKIPDCLPVYLEDRMGRNVLVKENCEYDVTEEIKFILSVEGYGKYQVYFYQMDERNQILAEKIFYIR